MSVQRPRAELLSTLSRFRASVASLARIAISADKNNKHSATLRATHLQVKLPKQKKMSTFKIQKQNSYKSREVSAKFTTLETFQLLAKYKCDKSQKYIM